MSDEEFLAAFERCSFQRHEWTHEAHIRMAWLYLSRLPFPLALQRVREGILRLNASHGSSGYHETITVAFCVLLSDRITAGEGYKEFCTANPDLLDKLRALERHYAPGTLFSRVARRRFISPDRDPLPRFAELDLEEVFHRGELDAVFPQRLETPQLVLTRPTDAIAMICLGCTGTPA